MKVPILTNFKKNTDKNLIFVKKLDPASQLYLICFSYKKKYYICMYKKHAPTEEAKIYIYYQKSNLC